VCRTRSGWKLVLLDQGWFIPYSRPENAEANWSRLNKNAKGSVELVNSSSFAGRAASELSIIGANNAAEALGISYWSSRPVPNTNGSQKNTMHLPGDKNTSNRHTLSNSLARKEEHSVTPWLYFWNDLGVSCCVAMLMVVNKTEDARDFCKHIAAVMLSIVINFVIALRACCKDSTTRTFPAIQKYLLFLV